jgi:hypothetical protein
MLRPLLAIGALALAAAPAAAATYSAKPAAPVGDSRLVARDVVWACGPEACVGSTQNSRPVVVCQSLAKKTGRIDSFLVDGRPLSAEELDRCNASARAQPAPALAAQ